MGSHFDVSESPWDAILAPRDHPGGPWEQQDGHEVARHRIFVDFGVISGPVYVGFSGLKCFKNRFLFRLVSMAFLLAISDSDFRRLGLPNRRFRMEGIAKIDFSWKSFSKNGIDF